MSDNKSIVANINNEINIQLNDPVVCRALLATTFKDLKVEQMKQAIMEGMIRGFKFKDFLDKNIYAIPFGNGYSLVTSIDYSRKVGMRSGVVGKDKPVYVTSEDGTKIISCDVTIKKRFADGYVGDFTSEVFFSEYDKGSNLWKTKPRTMIAKVAEMHALRMACPEELSQSYIEEEIDENAIGGNRLKKVDGSDLKMGKFKKDANKKEEKNAEDFSQEIQYPEDPTIEG